MEQTAEGPYYSVTLAGTFRLQDLLNHLYVLGGYLRENPMAEKRVELPRGSTKRTKQAVQLINACLVLPAPHEVAVAGKIGSGILGLARSSHQRGLRSQAAGFGLGRRHGHFSTRFRPGPYHIVENRGLANESAASGRRARPAAPMAVDHSPSNAKRLCVRLAVYQRRTSILACPTAQDSHQTGRSKSGFAEHRMAQFPPHGERLGERGRVGTGRCQNPIASREHRNHLGDLWDLGIEAKRRIQQRLINFVKEQVPATISVKDRDPYLSHEPFRNCLQPTEKNGSSGRTRTYNPPVNSRMLCH
jgi:hypothetical protein